MRSTTLTVRYASVLALAGLALACGGSGGDGDGGGAGQLFGGTYDFHYVQALPEEMAVLWGAGVAEGGDRFEGTMHGNASGHMIGPGPVELGVRIDEEHNLELIWDWGAVADVFRGAIATDGDLAAGATMRTEGSPQLIVLTRDETVHTAASLEGTYHLGMILQDLPGKEYLSLYGTLTLDGVMGGEFEGWQNYEGIQSEVEPTTIHYKVTDGGLLELMLDGIIVTGRVAERGNLVVASGGTMDAMNPAMLVLVKHGEGHSDASLDGTFAIVGFWPPNQSATGRFQVVESGTLQMNLTVCDDGTVHEDVVEALTYEVAEDGALRITSGGEEMSGAVSPDGTFGMLTGGCSDGAPPGLCLWFR